MDFDFLIFVLGIVLLIVGIVKRQFGWGKGLIAAGVILLGIGFFLGWPDFVRGFQDGMSG